MALSANAKKVLTWLVVAFVAFYLFTQPQASADFVRGVLGLLQDGAEAVGMFFSSLT